MGDVSMTGIEVESEVEVVKVEPTNYALLAQSSFIAVDTAVGSGRQ